MDKGGHKALAELLVDLQQKLQSNFAQLTAVPRRRDRGASLRRLLLGLELLSKLEEQTVLPAIGEAVPDALPEEIREALREIEVMRDVALLVRRTARANRALALAVLEGLALLHFAHINELVAQLGSASVNWQHVEAEVHALLAPWHAEVRAGGDIEDENADPVGPTAR